MRWDLRVNIALDVARGLEYLHDGVREHIGFFSEMMNMFMLLFYFVKLTDNLWSLILQAVPPVVHRDIKSANILLDHSMRARVCKK